MDARRYLVLLTALFAVISVGQTRPAQGIEAPPQLRKRVDFWVGIYTKYTSAEGVIHDAKYPEIVFENLDFRKVYNRRLINRRIREAKAFYNKTLLTIHQKEKRNALASLTTAEKRIYDLYAGIDEPNRFFQAAHNKRIRFQLGQRNNFMEGLSYSGRYLPLMEKIFREKGVPVDITRLPFVESSFNIKARSKVGASGIWQFMPSTGRLYLTINDAVDERNDPIRATEAAAELLRHNFEALQSWPLAITAYNHGRKGLMRAVRKVGSNDLSDLIANYRSRSFGFASSNFFTEFVAALEVERNAEKYFGSVERDKPLEASEFLLTDFVKLSDLAQYTKIPVQALKDLNPGLTDLVIKGKRLVPAGYRLRIPGASPDSFLAAYSEIPAEKKFSRQLGGARGIMSARQQHETEKL